MNGKKLKKALQETEDDIYYVEFSVEDSELTYTMRVYAGSASEAKKKVRRKAMSRFGSKPTITSVACV